MLERELLQRLFRVVNRAKHQHMLADVIEPLRAQTVSVQEHYQIKKRNRRQDHKPKPNNYIDFLHKYIYSEHTLHLKENYFIQSI